MQERRKIYLFQSEVIHRGGVIKGQEDLIVALSSSGSPEPNPVVSTFAGNVLHHSAHIQALAGPVVAPTRANHSLNELMHMCRCNQ